MSSRPLLSAGPEADESTRLRREIAGLERELQEAKDEAAAAKQAATDAVQAIRSLRQQLEPLHKSLRMIFGEISRADAGEIAAASPGSGRKDPRWESWKQRLGGKQAEFIELLLEHGEMTTAQLSAAAHCARRTVGDVVFRLNKAGILTKNGGRFSLKL